MDSRFVEYESAVKQSEAAQGLEIFAKFSFEPASDVFLNGESVRDYYQKKMTDDGLQASFRTPIQRERDRIVHSMPLRKLAEKFHVLYYKDQRISRNYITHVMRVAQVSRAICRGLNLNQDFAEAVALGSKVGNIPFKHIANTVVAKWAEDKIHDVAKAGQSSLLIGSPTVDLPVWLKACPSDAQQLIQRSMPVARMKFHNDRSYSAGKQSYLMLMTNPYELTDTPGKWFRETAFGIWRHSLGDATTPEMILQFKYDAKVGALAHKLTWENDTYEAMVVRLADDITWVIENLQDANNARLATSLGNDDLFSDIASQFAGKIGDGFRSAISLKDTGELYNLFIRDCIEVTKPTFEDKRNRDKLIQRIALTKGDSEAPLVALSSIGLQTLQQLKEILKVRVFGDPRTTNRNKVLGTIIEFAANQLYGSSPGALPEHTVTWIKQRAKCFPAFDAEPVITKATNDPYFRVQLVINVLSEHTDSDVFQMVGMGGL